jgi:nucleoside-diphosphate-sugar epimerase
MAERGTLFLTGATGHTGCRVARRLLDDGWQLRCLSRTPAHRQFIPSSERVRVIAGDLHGPCGLVEHIAGCTAVIHMAHVGFVPVMLGLCESCGIRRFICLSSTRRFTRFAEETSMRVIAGETALENSSLDFTALRSTMIFGGPRDRNIGKIVRWLKRCRLMPLIGGGRNLLQPVFVEDLVEAVVLTLNEPAATHRKFLTIAGPEPMTQRLMVEKIGRILGRPPVWLPVPWFMMYVLAWILEKVRREPFVNRAKIRRLLEDKDFDISETLEIIQGWQPRSFEEAVELKISGSV